MWIETFEAALAPAVIAGAVCIFTSWFWMGFAFHRYQKLTPGTWRAESGRSYALSIAAHFAACLVLATFYLFVAKNSHGAFGNGIAGAFEVAFLLWAGLALPVILDAAIFIRLHPAVVIGQLLDWLTTSMLACVVVAWWRQHSA